MISHSMKSEISKNSFLVISLIFLHFTFITPDNHSDNKTSAPIVNIVQPGQESIFKWGDQVRYRITVSDIHDGDSRFGEIKPLEVLLETSFVTDLSDINITRNTDSSHFRVHEGLYLMKKSTCFGCHSDKTMLVGPSFSDISEKYPHNSETLHTLAMRIVNGSSGKWGEIDMPPHYDLSVKEAEKISEYILEQGGRKNSWVYPGLEGVFRIIEKPTGISTGYYVLNASYVNNAPDPAVGLHTILIEIR